MKKIIYGLLGLFIASQLMVSCSSETEVLGQFSKRKYLKKYKAKNVNVEDKVGELENEITYKDASINEVYAVKSEDIVAVDESTNLEVISEFSIPHEIESQVETIQEYSLGYSVWESYNRTIDFSSMEMYHNVTTAEVATSVVSKSSRASELLIGLLCFFLPPVGVLVYEDSVTTNFWVDLVGTLLFWFPGMILAFLICFADVSF